MPTDGHAEIIHGNALDLPLKNDSVDLIITSPPYFALRSYRDDGKHYEGQIGAEPTPKEFIDALIAATAEMRRVLKPEGSIFVNLGDKYAGSGGHNNSNIGAKKERAPTSYNKASEGIRAKSLMGLPWRYAIRCIDELELIMRAEIIWSKPNGLPESVTDRVRRSHEQWFHFTKSPKYFAAVDEIREAYEPVSIERAGRARLTPRDVPGQTPQRRSESAPNPLGKLPGSVWTVATEPLKIPEELGVDHFAAFPTAWPIKIIKGWSPSGICTECSEGRRPVVEKDLGVKERDTPAYGGGRHGRNHSTLGSRGPTANITGYSCACPEPTAPTRPAVVLDPFGGTGTTALVAKVLDRHGISVDLSKDYCRLAEWRTNDERQIARVRERAFGTQIRRKKATASTQGLF